MNQSSPDKGCLPQLLLAAVRSLNNGFMTVNRENRVTYMNPAAEDMTGWTLQEALGKPSGLIFRVVNAVTGKADWKPIRPSKTENRPFVLLPSSVLIRRDMTEVPIDDTVSPLHDEAGEVDGAVITFRDLGKSVSLLRDVLERTRLDELTGLSNRTILQERLEQNRESATPTLIYLDLDHFKEINDTHGHAAGDFVLQTIAQRVRASVVDDATVCRLGGDEFVVLLDIVWALDAVKHCVERLLTALREPILFSSTPIYATASVGVAIGKNGQMSSQELIALADQLMYRAKQAGGNRAEWHL